MVSNAQRHSGGGNKTDGRARLYKCPVCDTVVEILEPCGIDLVCCGPEMIPLGERTCGPSDPHAIIIERRGGQAVVRVGRRGHSMEVDHHIAWIEVTSAGQCCRQFLRPGDPPEAIFAVNGADVVARAYCNAHGLWRTTGSWKAARKRYMEAAIAAMASA
ncbi:MAG: desulfoferrodoxin family protein [Phycisphaerae bacterium]